MTTKFICKLKDKTGRRGDMEAGIMNGKAVVRFATPMQAEATYRKMKQDGKSVIMARGMIIQSFPNKTEKEIVEMFIQDTEAMKLPEVINSGIIFEGYEIK